MKEREKSTYRKIEYHKKESIFLIIRGLETGIASGLVAVVYRALIELAEKYLLKAVDFAKSGIINCIAWFCVIGIIGFAVSKIIKAVPNSSGSGIPQVTGELKGYLETNWLKTLLAKLFAGCATVFAGASLGREGPSVQLGALAAKGVAKITKADKTTQLRMLSSGGGAGLAAAFNTPLAGVMFVLEEVHHTIDKSVMCISLVACVVADFVSKIFFGQHNVFNFEVTTFPLRYYWLLIIIGVLLGVLGCCFTIGMSKIQDLYKSIKVPDTIKMIIVFLLGGVTVYFVPQLAGGGSLLVSYMNNTNPTILMLLILLLAKYIFTAVCSGSSQPGGTLLPMLVMGTYIGAVFANIAVSALNLSESLSQTIIVVTMAGFFASVVRAPITAVLLIFELTGSFDSLLPLASVCIISYAVANFMGVNPLYHTLLEKIIEANPQKPEFHIQNEKVLRTFTVPIGSPVHGKKIREIDWGKHCLIVSVEREDMPITPKGDTVILEGDELHILVSQRRFSNDNEKLERIINGYEI